MKRITIILSFLCFVLPLRVMADDSRAMAAMEKDYPGLMALYGDRIAGQKAPGKGEYCEATGFGFSPGDIPKHIDKDSIIVIS